MLQYIYENYNQEHVGIRYEYIDKLISTPVICLCDENIKLTILNTNTGEVIFTNKEIK